MAKQNIDNQQSERMKFFIEKCLNISVNKFSQILGYKDGTKIYNILYKRNNISYNVLQDIKAKYPSLNSEWLMHGKGDVFEDISKDVKSRLMDFVRYMQKSNLDFEKACDLPSGTLSDGSINPDGITRILHVYPNLSKQWLLDGVGEMINKSSKDRLMDFIRYMGLNVPGFCKKANIPEINIVSDSITKDDYANIENTFPDLNMEWIFDGEGDMLIDNSSSVYNSTETEYGRLKNELKKMNISVSDFEEKLGWKRTYIKLSSKNGEIPDSIWQVIEPQLPKESANYVRNNVEYPNKGIEQPVVCEPEHVFARRNNDALHDMSDGTKGIIIPFHLDSCDSTITNCNMEKTSISNIISKNFTFFYQLQTEQLQPQLSKGDWLLLEPVRDLTTLIDGKIYLFNTTVVKVTCRMYRCRNNHIELVDINDDSDVIELESLSNIREAFDIISALRNNPLIPFYHTMICKEIQRKERQVAIKDKQIESTLQITQDSINLNKTAIEIQKMAIDEIIRSNKRMENLYFNSQNK